VGVNPAALNDSLMPRPCWNTHVACLQRLCDAAGLGLDLIDVAGITGLAFRTALCTQVTPASLYHTWSWSACFRVWLDLLGLDADIAEHNTALRGYDAWAGRQQEQIRATLARGFPVLYWDNLGFALILGVEGDGYLVSGVPAFTVHPLWREQPEAAEFLARVIDPADRESLAPKLAVADCFTPTLDDGALLVYVHGVAPFRQRQALLEGLLAAWRELSGMVEHPRVKDTAQAVYAPQFGTAALKRWDDELRDGSIHPFGQIMAVQALAEARRWAWQYLKRVSELVEPKHQETLGQVAEFLRRVTDYWRQVQGIYNVPLDEKAQLREVNRQLCRDVIYQVQQTEETARRLLGSVVSELWPSAT
jgi:hypothetical protein